MGRSGLEWPENPANMQNAASVTGCYGADRLGMYELSKYFLRSIHPGQGTSLHA